MHKRFATMFFLGLIFFLNFNSTGEELPYETALENIEAQYPSGTAAYLDGSTDYSSDDLAETPDTLITDEIKAKVKELNYDPVKIYEFVRNNIDFVPYYGSKLGATGTLYEKRANSFDQASLLIAMYRYIGIPCRYVRGKISLNYGRMKNWLGVKSLSVINKILQVQEINFVFFLNNMSVEDHIWVEAYIPYAGTRGKPLSYRLFDGTSQHLIEQGEGMWIPLDPSFKKFDNKFPVSLPEGMPLDALDFFNQYINSPQEKMPDELYIQNLKQYLRNKYPEYSPEDLTFERYIIPEKTGILPTELPVELNYYQINEEFSAVPENDRWKIDFNLKYQDIAEDANGNIKIVFIENESGTEDDIYRVYYNKDLNDDGTFEDVILFESSTPMTVDANGNLLDSAGNILTNADGQILRNANGDFITITEPLCEIYNKRISLNYDVDETTPDADNNYYEKLTNEFSIDYTKTFLTPVIRIGGEVKNDTTQTNKVKLACRGLDEPTTITHRGFIEGPNNNVLNYGNAYDNNSSSSASLNKSPYNLLQLRQTTNFNTGNIRKIKKVLIKTVTTPQYARDTLQLRYGKQGAMEDYVNLTNITQTYSYSQETLSPYSYSDDGTAWNEEQNIIVNNGLYSWGDFQSDVDGDGVCAGYGESIVAKFSAPNVLMDNIKWKVSYLVKTTGFCKIFCSTEGFYLPDHINDNTPTTYERSMWFIPSELIFNLNSVRDNYEARIYYVWIEYRKITRVTNNTPVNTVIDITSDVIENGGWDYLKDLLIEVKYTGSYSGSYANVNDLCLEIEYEPAIKEKILMETTYTIPRTPQETSKTNFDTASIISMYINYDQANENLIESRFKKLKELEEYIDSGDATTLSEPPLSEILYTFGAKYYFNSDRDSTRLTNITNTFLYNILSYSYVNQRLSQDGIKWSGGPYILDSLMNSSYSISRSDKVSDTFNFQLLDGMTGSAHEHKIFEEIFNISAVSTMRILRLAQKAADNELYYITLSNYSAYSANNYAAFDNSDVINYSFIGDHFSQTGTDNDVFIIPKRMTNEEEAGVSTGSAYILLEEYSDIIQSSYMIFDAQGNPSNGGYGSENMDAETTNVTYYNTILGSSAEGANENDVNFSLMSDYEFNIYIEGIDDALNYLEDNIDTVDCAAWDSLETLVGESIEELEIFIPVEEYRVDSSDIVITEDFIDNYYKPKVVNGNIQDHASHKMHENSDPVDMRTGEFYAENIDVKIPGRLPIIIKRNYSSQQESFDFIGYGWILNLNYFLWANKDALTLACTPTDDSSDYKSAIFRLSEDDGAVIEYSYHDSVEENGDLEKVIFQPDPSRNPKLVNLSDNGVGSASGYLGNQIVFDITTGIFTYTSYTGLTKTFIYKKYTTGTGDDEETIKERLYLQETKDINGDYLKYEYFEDSATSGYGLPKQIVNRSGSFVDFQYDIKGRVSKIISSDKREIQYFYDRSWNLSKVIDASGKITKYEYAETETGIVTHNLQKIIKPDNRILENIYDREQVVEQRMTYDFDATPRRTSRFEYSDTDENGYRTTTVYTAVSEDVQGNLKEVVTEYKYEEKVYLVDQFDQCFLNFDDPIPDNLAKNSANTDYNDDLNDIEYSGTIQDTTDNSLQYNMYDNAHFTLKNTDQLGTINLIEFLFKFEADVAARDIYINNINKNKINFEVVQGTSNKILKINATFMEVELDEIEIEWLINTWYKIKIFLDSSDNKIKVFIDEDLKSENAYILQEGQEENLIDNTNNIAFYCVTPCNRGNLENVRFSSPVETHPLRLLSVTNKDSAGTALSSVHRTWDDKGNLLTLTDANSTITSYNYDSLGRLSDTVISYDQNTTDDDETTVYTYFSDEDSVLKNKIKTVTDPRQKKIEYSYVSDSESPLKGSVESIKKYKNISDETNFVVEDYNYTSDGLLTSKTISDSSTPSIYIDFAFNYDRFGNVTSVTNPMDETTEFAYDEWGNRIRVTNPMNETMLYAYDNANRIIKITDPEQNSTEFEYDKNGNKIVETNALGVQQFYLYDYSDSLLGVLDPLDNTVITNYDIYGNKTEITNQNNYTRSFVYDDLNRVIEEKDIASHYDTGSNEIITSYSYDSSGNVLSKEIKSRIYLSGDDFVTVSKIEYEYNHRNQVTLEKKYTQTDEYILTEYEYDKAGNLVKEKHFVFVNDNYELDTYIQYEYSIEFDGEYRLKKVTAFNAGNTELSSVQYEYDYLGNKIKETDVMGHITQYEYDNVNRLTKTKVALNDNPQTDSDYAITEIVYDQAGRTVQLIDANANSTYYEYDKAGRLILQRDAENRITRFKYDAVGNKTEEISPSGKTVFYIYDDLNRLISIKDEYGNESQIEYDGLGNQIKTVDAEGNTTTYGYDELSRPVQITDPLDYTVNYKYDFTAQGNLTKTMLAQREGTDQRKTVWTQDWLAQTLSVEDGPNGEKITSYIYDDYGRLVSETTPNGDEILYDYDDLGNLIRKTCAADSRIDVSYSYDKLGRRTVMSDITGTTEYDYDILGNLKLKRLSNKLGIVYQNDYLGNVTKMTFSGINYPGSWAASTDLKSIPTSIQYTYNNTYQLESILHNNNTVTYDYNDAGLLAKQTNPDSSSYVLYDYDALDRLSLLKNSKISDVLISSQKFQYDNLGNKVHIVTGRGTEQLVSTYRYDKKNQLVRELYKDVKDAQDNRATVNVKYTYDGTGNRLEYQKVTGETTETHTYTVNNLNQVESIQLDTTPTLLTSLNIWGLFNEDSSTSQIYVNGFESVIANNIFQLNSLNISTPPAAITVEAKDSASQVLDSVVYNLDNQNDICYTYDDNGNLIYKSQNGQGVIYLWDALNRLADVYYLDDNSAVKHNQYLYNGDGQRIYEISDGSLKGYLYDGNQVIAEFDDAGKVTAQHIHGSGLGGDIGSLVYKEELNSANALETSYYFYNYRGDVIDVVSGLNTVSYRYDAFGNVIEITQNGDGIENSLLFSSKRFNDAIGLSYFGARYYDAFIGRFISRDTMGYIDGPNHYFYVANNPLGYIDPWGLEKYDINGVSFIRHASDHHPDLLHIEGLGNGRNYVNITTGEMFETIRGKTGAKSKGPLPAKLRKALRKIGVIATVAAIVLDVTSGESFADAIVNQIDAPLMGGTLGTFGEGDEDWDGIPDFKDTDSSYYIEKHAYNNIEGNYQNELDTKTTSSLKNQVNNNTATSSSNTNMKRRTMSQ